MPLQLPDFRPFQQHCSHENGWSDHYGSLKIAAAYCECTLRERYFLKGIWQHGCFAPWTQFSSSLQIYNASNAQNTPIFVARKEQQELLRSAGYNSVQAIGLPIIYTPLSGLEKIASSLLVIPTHTLTGEKFADRLPFERYADEIKSIAHSFSQVVICVHPICRENGLWVKEFTERGFHVVFGAQTNDANALLRMRALFDQFETVTTNGWGSHVAYALTFGAKVSIYGTAPQPQAANLSKDLTWAVDPNALKEFTSSNTRAQEREFLKRLYVSPVAAVAAPDLGRWLVGEENKISPDEMRVVLGNLLDPAPVPLPVTSAAISAGPLSSPTKRILFVTHEASRTGAPMYLLHFLRWLRRNTSQEFEVITQKAGPLCADFAKVGLLHTPKTLEHHPIDPAAFDLIYANSCCSSLGIEAWNYGEIPIITHIHELDTGYELLGARSIAATIKQSTQYIACARIVADRLNQRFHILQETIDVHYEVIDPDKVAPDSTAIADLRKTYDLPEHAFIVTACGTVDLRKGADLFVQLAARLKRDYGDKYTLRFLWIGAPNAADLMCYLKNDLRTLGLKSQFKFVGELPSPHTLISLSNVFCLTSREDPFPLAMLEAASLGKPVIAFNDSGGAAEFCSLGSGITVPFLDVSAMAGVCGELLQDPARASTIGSRGAAVVRERFSVEACAPALWEKIQTVLNAPTTRRPASNTDIYASWDLATAPQPAYVAANLTRAKIRKQAQALIRAGRRQEAAQSLVRAVNADLATQDGQIIIECLVEIGEDLAPIDSKQAGVLLAEAEKIARNTGANINLFRSRASAPAQAPVKN